MNDKNLILGEEVRKQLAEGVKLTVAAIGTTLGPKGQNVLIDSGYAYAGSQITKDGVTVLRNLVLKDTVANLAVKMIREASEKTVEQCGDGTTTTAVIAGNMYLGGLKHIAMGANPIQLKRGIDKTVRAIVASLDNIKKEVSTDEDIRNVATISANGDEEIGSLILQAIEKVGKEGVIHVQAGKGYKDELETTDGFQIDRGYGSPYFINHPTKPIAEFEKPLFLVTDYFINSITEILPVLEMANKSARPIILISDGGSAEVLQTLVANKMKGILQVCTIDAPGFGSRKKDHLQDIATMVGATFVSKDFGMELSKFKPEMFGTCEKIIVNRFNATIIEGAGEESTIADRLGMLETELSQCSIDYDTSVLKERIGKFKGGVAIIKVGGVSESDVSERKDRIDDALGATKAAIEAGIVPGGGCALLHAAQQLNVAELGLSDQVEKIGMSIVLEAIKSPLSNIVSNSGKSVERVVESIIESSEPAFGYDAATEEYGNMFEKGIIDPVKVTRSALINATGVASLLLTSGAILLKNQDKEGE